MVLEIRCPQDKVNEIVSFFNKKFSSVKSHEIIDYLDDGLVILRVEV